MPWPRGGGGYSLSAYHLYGNFSEKFPSNGTGIFFGTENSNGIELYHLQNTGKFFSFSFLFPEDFHRDEPFYLNSPRNFRVFHTNDKRSLLCPIRRKGYLLEASGLWKGWDSTIWRIWKCREICTSRYGKGPTKGLKGTFKSCDKTNKTYWFSDLFIF